jgi:hypothetical protein
MSNSTTVATRDETAVPALYQRIDTSAQQIPSIYLQQGLSTLVQDGITRPGDVVVGLGADDPTPRWLIGGDENREEFTAYILNRRISQARFHKGGDMEWLTPEEFEEAMTVGDREVWKTFHYLVCVPDIDTKIPMRLMLSKTAGTKPAKRINFFIDKAITEGDFNPVAIKFTVASQVGRESGQKYFALKVSPTTATKDGLKHAKAIQNLLIEASNNRQDDVAPDDGSQPGI